MSSFDLTSSLDIVKLLGETTSSRKLSSTCSGLRVTLSQLLGIFRHNSHSMISMYRKRFFRFLWGGPLSISETQERVTRESHKRESRDVLCSLEDLAALRPGPHLLRGPGRTWPRCGQVLGSLEDLAATRPGPPGPPRSGTQRFGMFSRMVFFACAARGDTF